MTSTTPTGPDHQNPTGAGAAAARAHHPPRDSHGWVAPPTRPAGTAINHDRRPSATRSPPTGPGASPELAARRTLEAVLTGYFLTLRHAVPRIRDAGGGSIVQIASISGHIGYGYPAHTAANGGVLAMTRQLASELAPMSIRINSISPGVIHTNPDPEALTSPEVHRYMLEHIPTRRIGLPEDVAAAV